MKIIIKAKPSSREDKIEKIDESNYTISIKAPPVNGKANAAIIKLLAHYFNVSPSLIEIISGHMTRTKIVEINL